MFTVATLPGVHINSPETLPQHTHTHARTHIHIHTHANIFSPLRWTKLTKARDRNRGPWELAAATFHIDSAEAAVRCERSHPLLLAAAVVVVVVLVGGVEEEASQRFL